MGTSCSSSTGDPPRFQHVLEERLKLLHAAAHDDHHAGFIGAGAPRPEVSVAAHRVGESEVLVVNGERPGPSVIPPQDDGAGSLRFGKCVVDAGHLGGLLPPAEHVGIVLGQGQHGPPVGGHGPRHPKR